MELLARVLIAVGLFCVGAGFILLGLQKLSVGRLPGDIVIQRDGFTFVFPVVTCLLLSLLLTAVVWLWQFLTRP
jgi:hypothetical protein